MRSALIRLSLICALFLAALGTGYALSSSLGQGAVRREAEDQLARLMHGRVTIERADIRIRSGLWIEGRGVRIYPSSSGPGLSGERVAARIDVIALLTGRFRLRDLILEGIRMEIERNIADRWSPYPIDAIDARGQALDPDDLERKLSVFRVIDEITRVLLESPFIAQRIELTRGSVRLIDRVVRPKGEAAFQLEINSIHGSLVHDWIGNRARLRLEGQLGDELGNRNPVEVIGERHADGVMDLSVAVTKLELESYRDYFWGPNSESRATPETGERVGKQRPFSGVLSGVLRFDRPQADHGVLEIDWSTEDANIAIPRGDEILKLTSPRLQLRTRLEIHPGRLRISEAELRGPEARIEVSGDIERPLRGSSPASLAVHFYDVGLGAIARTANALPEAERETVLRALARIEQGRIVRLGGSGTQRFSVWQAVLRGDRLELPPGLSMTAEVADVTLQVSEFERLTNLSGSATWTRDRIQILNARGQRNGVPTPPLNLTITGFPVLFEQTNHFAASRVSNPDLPGLYLLDRIFAANPISENEANFQPDPPVQIAIAIDYLEHSALLWPLRNAKVEAVLQNSGQSFHIINGSWGDAQLSGDVQLTYDPEPTVDAQLEVWTTTAAGVVARVAAAKTPSELPAIKLPRTDSPNFSSNPWASGSFRVDGLHGKHWPVGSTVGTFAFRGEKLELVNIRSSLVPSGNLVGNFRIDLSRSDQLSVETQFQIRDGHAGRLMEAVGFPDNFVSGTLDADGTLAGPIRPDRPAFAEVEGQIKLQTRNGEIRQKIPLVAALSHAAEGLSPARASDALLYDSIDSVVRFERGSIASDEIKLDGPLRIFLSGRFDFAKPGRKIDAEIGIFLFRQIDRLLGNLPLIGRLIPGGKDRGLFGAFFKVSGTLEAPILKAMPMKSLTDGTPLPDIVKAPFSAIREAFRGTPKKAVRSQQP